MGNKQNDDNCKRWVGDSGDTENVTFMIMTHSLLNLRDTGYLYSQWQVTTKYWSLTVTFFIYSYFLVLCNDISVQKENICALCSILSCLIYNFFPLPEVELKAFTLCCTPNLLKNFYFGVGLATKLSKLGLNLKFLCLNLQCWDYRICHFAWLILYHFNNLFFILVFLKKKQRPEK